MKLKRADELRRGQRILLGPEGRRTVAIVQGREDATLREIVPEEFAKAVRPDPVIGLWLGLCRPEPVPGVKGWQQQLITLWVEPDELFEPYV